MEWEHFEELGFIMSNKEDEGAEKMVAEKFLDGVPDELINQHIWPSSC
jgi:metal-dependent amidase/aminoacylase/carboxypeptidase family protein